MSLPRPLLFAAVAALASFACYTGSSDGLDRGGELSAPPLDHPLGAGLSATPRRMSADQWRASLPIIFGNDAKGQPITWVTSPGKPALASATIAAAFGEPDYIATTDEDLEPSVLYAKFTDDAARSVCQQVADADVTRTADKTRVLTRYASPTDDVTSNPTAIDANLRYLELRFHGVHVDATDSKSIAGLRGVFTTAASSSTAPDAAAKNRDGWLAVCVALVEAPEFHLY